MIDGDSQQPWALTAGPVGQQREESDGIWPTGNSDDQRVPTCKWTEQDGGVCRRYGLEVGWVCRRPGQAQRARRCSRSTPWRTALEAPG